MCECACACVRVLVRARVRARACLASCCVFVYLCVVCCVCVCVLCISVACCACVFGLCVVCVCVCCLCCVTMRVLCLCVLRRNIPSSVSAGWFEDWAVPLSFCGGLGKAAGKHYFPQAHIFRSNSDSNTEINTAVRSARRGVNSETRKITVEPEPLVENTRSNLSNHTYCPTRSKNGLPGAERPSRNIYCSLSSCVDS